MQLSAQMALVSGGTNIQVFLYIPLQNNAPLRGHPWEYCCEIFREQSLTQSCIIMCKFT